MTTTTNIFEIATRQKFRYPSNKGGLGLSTEQLWELPLDHNNPDVPTLDTVARAVNAELKSVTEESFVATKRNDQEALLTTKLDVVKHVIAVKIAEAEEKKAAATKLAEKRKLIEAIAEDDDAAIKNMSREDKLKRLAELS